MNNRMKKFQCSLYLFLVVLLVTFFQFQTNVSAKNTLSDNPDYENALATAPKGIKWGDNDFVIPKLPPIYDINNKNPDLNSNGNFANVVNETGLNSDSDVIQVTDAPYQVGVIWGNTDNNNYFDITKDQTVSMWIHLGNNDGNPADGMAFVLQNDARGENAAATTNRDPNLLVPGQSLGVWGGDIDDNNSDPSVVSNMAIQNSWALEFDTFLDDITDSTQLSNQGASFDTRGIVGQHIASNYPGEPSTYAVNNATGDTSKHFFSMFHRSYYGNLTLSDHKWHHMTLKWNAENKTMTYLFNDKNDDGTLAEFPIKSSTIIDTSKFHLKDGQKLRWGFTGATGQHFENNLIVFESIPSFVKANSSISVFDTTQDKLLSDSDNTVNSNDDLTFRYKLTYEDGSKPWKEILSDMHLPDHVKFNSGVVKYADSNTTEDLPTDLFANNNKEIKYKLLKELSNKEKIATIELSGRADSVTSRTKVPSAHASFKGDSFITDDDTPAFFIKESNPLLISTNITGPINLNRGDKTVVPSNAEYTSGKIMTNSKVTVYYLTNDDEKTKKSFRMIDTQPKGYFEIPINSDDLNVGKNTVTYYVKDDDGNVSNKITVVVNVTGGVMFGTVQENVSFKNAHVTKRTQIIPRFNSWRVEVVDGRKQGSSWTVLAKADDMYDGNSKLAGQMIFKDQDGVHYLDSNYPVAQNIKADNDIDTKDITSSWTPDSGILLQMNSNVVSGKYSGKIHWTLLDSI